VLLAAAVACTSSSETGDDDATGDDDSASDDDSAKDDDSASDDGSAAAGAPIAVCAVDPVDARPFDVLTWDGSGSYDAEGYALVHVYVGGTLAATFTNPMSGGEDSYWTVAQVTFPSGEVTGL